MNEGYRPAQRPQASEKQPNAA